MTNSTHTGAGAPALMQLHENPRSVTAQEEREMVPSPWKCRGELQDIA